MTFIYYKNVFNYFVFRLLNCTFVLTYDINY